MGIKLHAEWEPAILEFGRSYNSIASLMQPFLPLQKWPHSWRQTPKVHCVLHEMREWIAKQQKTLLAYSEQGSETLHCFYALHEQNWSVPVTGMQLDVREAVRAAITDAKRLLREKNHGQSHKVTDGTRSGQNKRRRLAPKRTGSAHLLRTQLDSSLSASRALAMSPAPRALRYDTESVIDSAPWDQPQSIKEGTTRRIVVGSVDRAIQQRMRSILAFVANRLPGESAVQKRVRVHFDWRNAGKSVSPPFSTPKPESKPL